MTLTVEPARGRVPDPAITVEAARAARGGRYAVPEMPTGEISLQSPPVLPKAGNGASTQMLFMMPMMLGMGAMSFVYIGRQGGPMTYIFGALYVSVMVGMLVMALSRGGMAKKAQINDERRDYQRYLAGLRTKVRDVAAAQRASLLAAQPDPVDLWAYLDSTRLWDRRRTDAAFGQVRVGLGPQRLATPLRAPQTAPLEDLDPVSSTALRQFIRTYSTVPDLPVALSLRSFSHVSMTGERTVVLDAVRAMLAQLTTFHAPTDLRVGVCLAPDRLADWEWLKWLPHATATTGADTVGPTRLVADSAAGLVGLLGDELGERGPFVRGGAAGAGPHVLVIVDGGTTWGDSQLVPDYGRAGVTVIDIGPSSPVELPSSVGIGLHVTADRIGMVSEDGLALLGRPDLLDAASAEALARQLSPLVSVSPAAGTSPMAMSLGLPGLLGLGDPRDIDPAVTWQRRSARDRLRLPIGVDELGRPVELDLKESAENGMGPHGLIIGATGSGKSELLRTLVTGLAVTHSSETLNMALIDFKGGATFAGMSELPHACAVITNLADDLALVDRMADAINGEIIRRQELLRSSGNYASVRDYERAREAGAVLDPLPSLLVIIDEFSELLSSRPEFIDLFVMIGRLGRSLGVHLLLASQRLEEGRLRGLDSHLSYRVGLRTFSASESRAVLGVPDAYELPPVPGSAFLKVDTTTLVRLKAAYVSGVLPARSTDDGPTAPDLLALPFTLAPAAPLTTEVAETPTTADLLDLVPDPNAETIMGTIVSRLNGRGPEAHQIWLPPLSDPPSLDALLPPLGVDPDRGLTALGWGGQGRLVVPVALVDKPIEQKRDLLWADLAGAAGHVIVVGAPQSGKSTLLRSLIGVLALTHTPQEAQVYVLDMGGGGLGPIAGLPHVSGYATRLDPDRARRIVAECVSLVEERERYFADERIESMAAFRDRRRADVKAGVTRQPRDFGDVFLVVDGWTTLRQEYEKLEEAITNLASRGLGFGVHVVVSTNRWMGVRAQLRDMIGTRFELRLGDPADSAIDRRAAQNVPADAPGRGITAQKLHFLTALPRVDGDQNVASVGSGTADMVDRISAAWTGPPAPQVRLLPREVSAADVAAVPGRLVPLGLAESTLSPVALDLTTDPHFIAFGDVEAGKTSLLRALARGICERYSATEAAVIVADYRRGLLDTVPAEHLLGYAGAEPVLSGLMSEVVQAMQKRLPGPDVTAEQLRTRSWWTGPELFVIVDDYELVASAGNPLQALVPFLSQARDIGLHLLVARGSGGASRAVFEPVIQRMRELGSPGLIMSGSKDEGVLLGDVKPSPQPPGRGTFVTRRRASEFVQVAWTPPPS